MNDDFFIARHAVRATQRILALPAIATQSWLSQCAEALCIVSEHAATMTLACETGGEHDGDRLVVLSSGVAFSPLATRQGSHTQLAITMQDRAERMNSLGLRLPEQAMTAGLIAPMQSIDPGWHNCHLARACASAQLTSPILLLLPIENQAGSLVLICVMGFSPSADPGESRRALGMLGALYEPLRSRSRDALARIDNPRAWLTEREQSVLALLIEGHSVRVIAERLGRSTHTIHDHVKNLHRKIGASSRGELIARALGHDNIHAPPPELEPIMHYFPGEPIAEIKPASFTARPLRS